MRLLICAGIFAGIIVLRLACGTYPSEILSWYYHSPILLFLNVMPVVLLILFIYGIIGHAGLAYFTGGAVVLELSLGNYYKLCFRDDPMYFEDMLLIREAKAMTFEQNYDLFLDQQVIHVLIGLLLGGIAVMLLVRGGLRGKKARISVITSVIVVSMALCPIYMSRKIYNGIENYEELNRWNPTQNYISHGFCYSFIHSIAECVDIPPWGYDRKEVEKILSEYKDGNISKDQQVNVIAVMREAYADFSKYHIPDLKTDGYEFYHKLASESYTGTLIVNAFAGGTMIVYGGF